jgi:hypothetical protein
MIRVTQNGNKVMIDAITASVDKFHLFTDAGELTGHGYSPIEVDPTLWDRGAYPEQEWTFAGGDSTKVLGYFASSKDGTIMFDEHFNDDSEDNFIVKNIGDKIKISVRLMLITQGG